MTFDPERIAPLVALAIHEDLGAGDVTSEAVVPGQAAASGVFALRAAGVIAGLPVAAYVYAQISPEVAFEPLAHDGDALGAGAQVARVRGPARAVLAGERTVLNFMQRMSGVATLTRQCVEAVRGTPCLIQDTRKTVPGWRYLDKCSVRVGRGANHRMGLYDQVLIKDNHLRLCAAGQDAIACAVRRARAKTGDTMEIEVECDTPEQVGAAIAAGADIIMLDNMSCDAMRRCAAQVKQAREARQAPRPVTEASGGLTPEDLADVAATGVDRISLGFLTHSAAALDIGLDLD